MKNQTRLARIAPDASPNYDAADICEMLVAELRGRRERLRQLLRLVAIEAERHSRARLPNRTRPACKRAAAA